METDLPPSLLIIPRLPAKRYSVLKLFTGFATLPDSLEDTVASAISPVSSPARTKITS